MRVLKRLARLYTDIVSNPSILITFELAEEMVSISPRGASLSLAVDRLGGMSPTCSPEWGWAVFFSLITTH